MRERQAAERPHKFPNIFVTQYVVFTIVVVLVMVVLVVVVVVFRWTPWLSRPNIAGLCTCMQGKIF